jgi:hypothetical protein
MYRAFVPFYGWHGVVVLSCVLTQGGVQELPNIIRSNDGERIRGRYAKSSRVVALRACMKCRGFITSWKEWLDNGNRYGFHCDSCPSR